MYYTLFPNTFFILHPDYVSINTFWPLAPDRTIWTHEMLYRDADFTGSAGQSALAKRFRFTNDTVFDQETSPSPRTCSGPCRTEVATTMCWDWRRACSRCSSRPSTSG